MATMTDLAGVKKRVRDLQPDDKIRVSIIPTGDGSCYDVLAECTRACWPSSWARYGRTSTWLVGVSRSAKSAKIRADRVEAMFKRERKKNHD